MSKVLVLYYSAYGHIEAMANAVAEGAREGGAQVDIKRVPELVPEEIARKSYYKLDQAAPIAKVDDLAAYDAIVTSGDVTRAVIAARAGECAFHIGPARDVPIFDGLASLAPLRIRGAFGGRRTGRAIGASGPSFCTGRSHHR